jgi:GNAT superfamily N-acetyltransferase
MQFREAFITDIPQMQFVRNSVKENVLSDPALVSDQDYVTYMNLLGKGWVCEVANKIVGFAMIDLKENNVWALFVHPEFEKQGIGRQLHELMLHWYFDKTQQTVWLGTAPNSRAELFYRKAGWIETGIHGKNEIKFEMSFSDWQNSTR